MRSWSDLSFWRWMMWSEMLTALPKLPLRPLCNLGMPSDQHIVSTCWVLFDFPLCLKAIVGHEDLISTVAESFPEVKGTRSSGEIQVFELKKQTKKQSNMTIVLWKLKIHSSFFILKRFGFGALKKQMFSKTSKQNEIISFCPILIGTFLYCPAWPNIYWSIWVVFVVFVCFIEKFTLCCVVCGWSLHL